MPENVPPSEPRATALGLDRLTGYDAAVIALRLLGIYCLLDVVPVISLLPVLPQMARSGILELLVFLVGFLPHVAYVAIGLWLLVGARPLARRLLPSAAAGSATLSLAGVEAQAIAFSVVGVVLVGQALPDLGRALAHALRGSATAADGIDVGIRWDDAIPSLVGSAAQAAFGVVLFLRARGLALLWHRIRAGGVRRPDVDDEADASRAEPPA